MNTNASFLPDDYLDQKAERRTNVICLALFAVVMLGVFVAFLVTNQRWTQVKTQQEMINVRYQQAAREIDDLVELEKQKGEMLQKAELAAALVERVPRSVLLAEVVNRMPERLSLLEFELESEKIKRTVPAAEKKKSSRRLKPSRAKTKKDAEKSREKIQAPKYTVKISLVGVAPTGQEVSRFLKELNDFELLRNVSMTYTEQKEVEDQMLQKFNITMTLDPTADVRDVEPRIVRRQNDRPSIGVTATPAVRSTSVDADPFHREGE